MRCPVLTATSSFVYLGDFLLFRIDSGSTTAHFYASDLSNNVRLVWSYSTSVTAEAKYRYRPFGEQATPLVSPTLDSRWSMPNSPLFGHAGDFPLVP